MVVACNGEREPDVRSNEVVVVVKALVVRREMDCDCGLRSCGYAD